MYAAQGGERRTQIAGGDMLLSAAVQGGQLAAAIDATQLQVNAVNTAIANTAMIVGGSLAILDPTLANPSAGPQIPQVFPIAVLSAQETNSVFNTMLTILNARIATYSATLSGL